MWIGSALDCRLTLLAPPAPGRLGIAPARLALPPGRPPMRRAGGEKRRICAGGED